jgi:hypothetical protein
MKQALMTPNDLKDNEENKYTQNNFWLQIINMRIDSMESEFSGVYNDGIEIIRKLLPEPIIIYIVRVFAPSILLYQRNPHELFKEAKNGKLDSLAKLLVIDKEILRDETIFGLFNNAAQKDKELEYNMLTKAFRQTPADLVSSKKVKVAVARLILDVSKFLGHRFTINEIRDLYDRIEKDRKSDDDVIDEEGTYDSEDSFYKAVTRHTGYEFLFPPVSDKIF